MVIDIIFVIAGLIGLIIASISDIKTREVPDWLSYSLIAIGLTLRLFHALTYKEWPYFTQGLIGFIVFFIIANLMYYTKQWGGGDAKLLMGLGILFATYPSFLLKYFQPKLTFPFLLILWINILLVGASYGLIFTIVLTIKHRKKFLVKAKKLLNKKKIRNLTRITLAFAILFALSTILVKDKVIDLIFLFAAFLMASFPYIWIFTKSIEEACMYHYIPVKKLTEGDWIVDKSLKKRFTISELGIEKKQINLLIKSKIKEVLVKEGIPFVPSFLIALIISLIFGSVLQLILMTT